MRGVDGRGDSVLPRVFRVIHGTFFSGAFTAAVVMGGAMSPGFGEYVKRTHSSGPATLPYQLFIPEGYDGSREYGVVLVLHGAGERGTNNTQQLDNSATAWCEDVQKEYPTFVVFPQCASGTQWVDVPWGSGLYDADTVSISAQLASALDLLDAVIDEFSIDRNRQYITGLSMGGFGVWDALVRYPDRFAAAMPVCGGTDPSKAEVIADIPIWTFHGARDGAIDPRGTRRMIEAVEATAVDVLRTECPGGDCAASPSGEQLRERAAGYHVIYTEYPFAGHNVWDQAYGTTEALGWVLSKIRPNDNTPPSPPAGVAAAPLSDRSVRLSWDAAADAESGVRHYNVYRNGEFLARSSGREFVDDGLDEQKNYAYTVSAVNWVRLEGPRSEPASATTEPDLAPPVVRRVFAASTTEVRVVFDECIRTEDAGNASLFEVDGRAAESVTQVKPHAVAVRVAPMEPGREYTLTVSGVRDCSAQANTVEPLSRVFVCVVSEPVDTRNIATMLVLTRNDSYRLAVDPMVVDARGMLEAAPYEGGAQVLGNEQYLWKTMHAEGGQWFREGESFYACGSFSLLAAESCRVSMHVRHDDDLGVWRNGESIIAEEGWDGGRERRFEVDLSAGINRFLIRLMQKGGGSIFSCRFSDTNGEAHPMVGLVVPGNEAAAVSPRISGVAETPFPGVRGGHGRALTVVLRPGVPAGRASLHDCLGRMLRESRHSGVQATLSVSDRSCGTAVLRVGERGRFGCERVIILR